MMPPRLPRIVLSLVVPRATLDCIIGDLDEEFLCHTIRERTVTGARVWYWRQIAKSVVPLMRSAAASSTWQITFALVFLAAAGQTVAFDRFWSAVVCYVPLKVDLVRDSTYMIAHLALTFVLALVAGTTCRLHTIPPAFMLSAVLTALGIAAMHGITPEGFALLHLVAVAGGITLGAVLRHVTSRPGDLA
jgi:hypothetical protein